ncbi:MAG: hypothetical protein K1X72_25035 [Pyrinomonadaceae bacterium]|nr:hypothetical protein [Pyrinomonadaceae bacterium]
MKKAGSFFSKKTLIFFMIAMAVVCLPSQIVFAQLPENSTDVRALDDASNFDLTKDFRIEKTEIKGGSELITVFAALKGLKKSSDETPKDVPLVSILRDTLGDNKVENDSLRYLWMLTYTKPCLLQRASAFIPFLYTRTNNKKSVGDEPPPALLDMRSTDKQMWNKIFWIVFRHFVLNDMGSLARTPSLHYRENLKNYQKTAIVRALALISLYEAANNTKILSDSELREIQARLLVSDSFFAPLMQRENLDRLYEKGVTQSRDVLAQNWELLRQFTESQGLIFEPLSMPDGKTTHAIVWTTQEDISANQGKDFEGRFLNVKNPWKDERLTNWKGYKEVRWYDAENRQVEPNTPNATSKTLIPLGLYGLDFPKIPTLLVDFRDTRNPKKREMSKRILDDFTRALSISRFGNFPFFVGKFVYDYVTARRGMDINQVSRFQSYSQLKLLLSLNASLDSDFRNEISQRLEVVSLNPLENNLDVEVELAQKQYANLMAYALREDGLSAKIEKDRREEMVYLKHSGKERMWFAMGNFLSFGLYTHREKSTPELMAKLDIRRQLGYHERFLRQVAISSAKPEIDSNLETIRASLQFIAENGADAGDKTVKAISKIFTITAEENIKKLCLDSLYKINRPSAKKELLALYQNPQTDNQTRSISLNYLRQALKDNQKISPTDATFIAKLNND